MCTKKSALLGERVWAWTHRVFLLTVLAAISSCTSLTPSCLATPPVLTATVHYKREQKTVIPDADLTKLLNYIETLEDCAGV